MKRLPVLLGVVALFAVASTLIGQTEVTEAPMTWRQVALSDGEELYNDLCAVCHGTGGEGDGPAADALKMVVPDLTSLASGNDGVFPRQEVEKAISGQARIVSHGTIDMPIWGQAFEDLRPGEKRARRAAFSNQKIYNLIEHLESLQAE